MAKLTKGLVSPFFRQKEVAELLRGDALRNRAEKAGWLSPVVRAKKLVLYRRDEVLAVIARLEAGELPPVCYSKKEGA